MDELFISLGGRELIDETEQLWGRLNAHHLALSPHFPEQYASKTFAARKAALLEKADEGGIGVILALDQSGTAIGYCISTVSGKIGEIDSLYIVPEARGTGLGDTMMKMAMAWLSEQGATRTRLSVAAGNERVFGFYARHGLFPAKIILEQKE